MKHNSRFGQGVLTVLFILSFALQGIQPAAAQADGGERIKRHPQTGRVSFIGAAPGKTINLAGPQAPGLTQKDRALAMIQHYAADFGLKQANKELKLKKVDKAQGRQITRFQQTYQDVPVMAGELVVDAADSGGLVSINGEISPDLSLSTKPSIAAEQARETALGFVVKRYQGQPSDYAATDPELWIYDSRLLQPDGTQPALVWRIDVTRAGEKVRVDELVLVNAQSGGITLHIDQVDRELFPLPAPEAQATEPPPTQAPTEPPITETPAPTEAPTQAPTEPPVTETPAPTEAPAELDAPQAEMGALSGTTRYVATTGSDAGSNTCTDPASPCATIQYAHDQAAGGDTIEVTAGAYPSGESPVILINKSITLSGGWNSAFTSQSGTSVIEPSLTSATVIAVNGTGLAVNLSHLVVQHGFYGILHQNTGGTLNVESSALLSNSVGLWSSGNATITNTTISGNSTSTYSGIGIFSNSGTVVVQYSTISDNTGTGHAVYGSVQIGNSILAGNTSYDCYGGGGMTSLGYNIFGRSPACRNTTTMQPTDKVGVDPKLSNLMPAGFYTLAPDSPAIDAAGGTCPGTDQRGMSRPYNGACDIGAVEYTPPGPPASISVLSGSGQRAGLARAFAAPLAAAVTDASGMPVAGATVTFTAPAAGATGSFPGDLATGTATTNASGIATSPAFASNTVAGTYDVVASVEGLSGSAAFSLTNVELYVAPGGSLSGSCTDPGAPCGTINYALSQAVAGDLIKAAAGIYTSSDTEVVDVSTPIILSGGWNSGFTAQDGASVLDGQGARRGIYASGAALSLEHFTIQNGYGSLGGGIYTNSSLAVSDSVLSNNHATLSGGGIYGDSSLSISHSVLRNNSATNSGGAIYKAGTNTALTLDSSSVEGNGAAGGSGGGIYTESGTVAITNSTITGNSASSSGGGMNLGNAWGSINGSTIVKNTTGTLGGGFYANGMSLALGNSILFANSAGNAGPDCNAGSGVVSHGHNIIGNTTGCGAVFSASDQTNTDPQIGSMLLGVPGYYPLLSTSPAIDAGDPETCPNPDVRGMARPVGAACDIGAYEYSTPGAATTMGVLAGASQRVAPNQIFHTNLSVYVLDANGSPVPGLTVTFTAPGSGATGAFVDSDGNTTTAQTDSGGVATAAAFKASAALGSYVVQATAPGISGSVDFSLSNLAIYVDAARPDDSGDCASPATACKTINAAISKAVAGDILVVAAGTYSGATVSVTKAVDLEGGWNSAFTLQDGTSIVDGQATRQAITVTAIGTVTLTHFTVQNGYATDDIGAGIRAGSGTLLVLEDCVIQDNDVSATVGSIRGAGVAATTVTINRCEIARNHVNSSNAQPVSGGGIGATTLTVHDSYIHDNGVQTTSLSTAVGAQGAGMYVAGTLTMTGSTVSNNVATSPNSSKGGGIYAAGAASVGNSSIFGNVAGHNGGGIFSNAAISINNSTIAYNLASQGGGLYRVNSNVTIKNTIVTGNTGGDIYGTVSSDHNFIGSGAKLAPFTIGDTPVYPLLGTSPAIDTGNPATCLGTDQRGTSRPVGAACDIGAYEYTGPGTVPAHLLLESGDEQNLRQGQALPLPLKALVIDATGASVPGVNVTFTAPASGATGSFSNDTNQIVVATGGDGVASLDDFTANDVPGAYSIQASAEGVAAPVNFSVLNVLVMVRTTSMNHQPDEGSIPGTFVCDLWDPDCTGGVDPYADAAQDLGQDYARFLYDRFGRLGLDGQGSPINMVVHWSYANSVWYEPAETGYAVFGDGWAEADDVVGHELTHGMTHSEAELFYWYQSGAIDESLADIFGELFDQANPAGNDAASVKWLIGEDLPGRPGGVRSMSTPTIYPYSQPDKMISTLYDFDADLSDSGGVHKNAGINNKAAYLLINGGTFNGKTVAPLGADKTLALYYEVDTNLLTSGADYGDLAVALYQGCLNLVGGPSGMTFANCTAVQNAVAAVQMSLQPKANFNTDAPPCPTTTTRPKDLFYDDFENGLGKWTVSNPLWHLDASYGDYAHSGLHSLYANDTGGVLSDTNATMANAVTVPPASFLLFSHAYVFEYYPASNGWPAWYNDGGVLEYSVSGGTWIDARSLMQYNGYDFSLLPYDYFRNPLGGRKAFAADSHGYISTRLNLAGLAGKNVKFRWRMGLDNEVGYGGWWIDDVRIYTCAPATAVTMGNKLMGNYFLPAAGATPKSYANTSRGPVKVGSTDGVAKLVASKSSVFYNAGTPLSYSEMLGLPKALVTTEYWFPQYSNTGTSLRQQLVIANLDAVYANTIEVSVGGLVRGTYTLGPSETVTPSYDIEGGPVRVRSTNGKKFITSLRSTWLVGGEPASYSEMLGLPKTLLYPEYYFPWYNNSNPPGPLEQTVIVANADALYTANVEVSAHGVVLETFPLLKGQVLPKSYNVDNGPLRVRSTNGKKIIASVSAVQQGASYNEWMGLPKSKLSYNYYLPWYDNATPGELAQQVRVVNVDTVPLTVEISAGGVILDNTHTLQPGQSMLYNAAPAVESGTLRVRSTSGRKIIVSIQSEWMKAGVPNSYSELIGLPYALASPELWFPWYGSSAASLAEEMRFGKP